MSGVEFDWFSEGFGNLADQAVAEFYEDFVWEELAFDGFLVKVLIEFVVDPGVKTGSFDYFWNVKKWINKVREKK